MKKLWLSVQLYGYYRKSSKEKKWSVSSTPFLQMQVSEGVSEKLWRFLWWRNLLKPTLNWNKCRREIGSWIPKIEFVLGRKSEIRWFFNSKNVGKFWKDEMKLFHSVMALGKKLPAKRSVRVLNSWKTCGRLRTTFLIGVRQL